MSKTELLDELKDNLIGTDFTIGEWYDWPHAVFYGDEVIGCIKFENDTMIYLKKLNEKKHTLKKWGAWGFSEELIVSLPVRSFVFIQSDKTQYLVSREKLLSYGAVAKFPPFEEQIFLPKGYFTIIPYKNKEIVK